MKKTIRVHKKSSTASAISQVKTVSPVADDNPIFLALYSEKQGIMGKIYLTRDEFGAILRNVEIRNGSFEKVMAIGVRRMIEVTSPGLVLEFATIETNALLQLLADNFEYQRSSGCTFEGPQVESICAGIGHLVSNTQNRLKNAVNEVTLSGISNGEVAA